VRNGRAGARQSDTGDVINIDDGVYFENLEVTRGQTLRWHNFIGNDSGDTIIDGGIGIAITVTGTPGAQVINLVVRGGR